MLILKPLEPPQVVPDPEALALWAGKKENGVANGGQGMTHQQLCADPVVVAGVKRDMDRVARAAKLKGFEMAKAIHLDHEAFSVDRGLLTPTFKLKRQPARDFYRATIDALYQSIGAGPPVTSKL